MTCSTVNGAVSSDDGAITDLCCNAAMRSDLTVSLKIAKRAQLDVISQCAALTHDDMMSAVKPRAYAAALVDDGIAANECIRPNHRWGSDDLLEQRFNTADLAPLCCGSTPRFLDSIGAGLADNNAGIDPAAIANLYGAEDLNSIA